MYTRLSISLQEKRSQVYLHHFIGNCLSDPPTVKVVRKYELNASQVGNFVHVALVAVSCLLYNPPGPLLRAVLLSFRQAISI